MAAIVREINSLITIMQLTNPNYCIPENLTSLIKTIKKKKNGHKVYVSTHLLRKYPKNGVNTFKNQNFMQAFENLYIFH